MYKTLGKKTTEDKKLATIVVMKRIPNWFRKATLQNIKKTPAKIDVSAPPKIV